MPLRHAQPANIPRTTDGEPRSAKPAKAQGKRGRPRTVQPVFVFGREDITALVRAVLREDVSDLVDRGPEVAEWVALVLRGDPGADMKRRSEVDAMDGLKRIAQAVVGELTARHLKELAALVRIAKSEDATLKERDRVRPSRIATLLLQWKTGRGRRSVRGDRAVRQVRGCDFVGR